MPRKGPRNWTDSGARDRLCRLLASCRDDPEMFNAAVLGRPPCTDYQSAWCRDVVAYRSLAIETGNMIGKDWWVALIVVWWLWTRKDSLVIVTGPGQTVLGSVTWKEIRRAVAGSPIPLGATISKGIKTSPHTVRLGEGWHALGFSTTSVERASGQHAGELLVIVEEASGIDESIWAAIESLGYTKLVAIGNPLRAEGGFVDLCEQAASDRARGVHRREAVKHVNAPSTMSPHATWDKSPVGLADRTWLDAAERRYGKDSLWYRAHVLAIRPTVANEQLIPTASLDRCVAGASASAGAAMRAAGRGGKTVIGCDVGEGCGNARTVVVVRDDQGVLELHASRYAGPADAAETICRLAEKHAVREEDVSYDGAGQTGKRLGNALSRRGLQRVRPYFGSSSGGKRC